MRALASLVVIGALAMPGAAVAAQMQSQYTDLDLDQCTTIEADDTGALSACPGYRGMPVMVGEGDLRMFVSFGLDSEHERAAEQTLPPFNYLGKKIEWRLEQDGDGWQPRATILRWFTSREEGQADGQVLVVTKIAPGATCHVAYIDALATKNANEKAREIADRAAGFDCADEPELVQPFKAF